MMETHWSQESLFRALAMEGTGWLLLDYDGTIAPFVPNRMEARPAPGLGELVADIVAQRRTRVVFVTGRPCRELLEVSGFPTGLEIWGCHGREYLDTSGALRIVGVNLQQQQALAEAAAATRDAIAQVSVEEKTGCVAVHWRSCARADWAALEAQTMGLWAEPAHSSGLLIKSFDGGLELCTPGRTKGDAIRELLGHAEQIPPVAFLGDDLTDEDGFAALGARGLSVLVRNEPRRTRANLRLTMPEGIQEFLHRWKITLQGSIQS